jgi:hypothetical protein
MSSEESTPKETIRSQFKTVLRPKNLIRTVASQIPGVGAAVEMINRIEGEAVDRLLQELTESDVKLLSKIEDLEKGPQKPSFAVNDWSICASSITIRSKCYFPFQKGVAASHKNIYLLCVAGES